MLDRARRYINEIITDVPGQLAKKLFGFLALLLAGYIATLVITFAGLPKPATPEEIPALLYKALTVYGVLLWTWLLQSYDLATDHPALSIAALVLVAGYLVFWRLLRRAHRRLNAQQEVLTQADEYRALLEQIGLVGRWPHAGKDENGASWQKLQEEILKNGNGAANILGANGAATFGDANSPLYDALGKFRGSVRVVLIHPAAETTKGRAAAVKADLREYRKAIARSKRRLQQLRNQNPAIDGRLYDGRPNWKLILTSETAWVQYYYPGGPDVDDTPVYRFDKKDHGGGFYQLFQWEFDRIWMRCENSSMKLK